MEKDSTITSSLPTCPLREEKSFSQRVFSIYTDIRKLQDKAKTSYTLSTRRSRFGYEQQFSRSTPGAYIVWMKSRRYSVNWDFVFVTALLILVESRVLIMIFNCWFIPYGNKSSSNLYFFLLGYISVRNEI